MEDHELLTRYVESGDQAAFASLAERYAGLVYSAARRRVGDAHLAHDVTQAVFLVLARKAPSLGRGTVLSAWLLKVTGYAAANLSRSEQRRQRLERAVAFEKGRQMNVSAKTPEADHEAWDRIAPVLDEALDRLSERGRAAVVLRWFEGCSFREVGRRLGISEEAAKQLAFRAMGRLREFVAQRGVTLPTAAIGALLAAYAVEPTPAATVQAAASAGSPAAAASAAGAEPFVRSVAAMAEWTVTRAVARAVAACLMGAVLVVGGAIAARTLLAEQRHTGVAGSGGGGSSAAFRSAAVSPRGVVVGGDGRPVRGAFVRAVTGADRVVGPGGGDAAASITDGEGRFVLAPVSGPYVLLAWHEAGGFAELDGDRAAGGEGARVELAPWAEVSGRATAGGAAVPHATVVLGHWSRTETGGQLLTWEQRTEADGEGRFVFPRVPRGEGWVGREIATADGSRARVHQTHVTAQPGRRVVLTLGSAAGSRVVTVRLVDPAARAGDGVRRSWRARLVRVSDGAEGPAYTGVMFETELVAAPGGTEMGMAGETFMAADVPAGLYELRWTATAGLAGQPVRTVHGERRVVVMAAEGDVGGPQDLGRIEVRFPGAGDAHLEKRP